MNVTSRTARVVAATTGFIHVITVYLVLVAAPNQRVNEKYSSLTGRTLEPLVRQSEQAREHSENIDGTEGAVGTRGSTRNLVKGAIIIGR